MILNKKEIIIFYNENDSANYNEKTMTHNS